MSARQGSKKAAHPLNAGSGPPLKSEATVLTELFLPQGATITESSSLGYEWCAVQTKSRQEKQYAEYLTKQVVAYFLPMRETKVPGHRSMLPLFSGVVFAGFTPDLEEVTYSSRKVFKVIRTKLQYRLVRELEFLNGYSTSVAIASSMLNEGQPAIVRDGHMKGIPVMVLSRDAKEPNSYLVLLTLKMLGTSVTATVHRQNLDLLPESKTKEQ